MHAEAGLHTSALGPRANGIAERSSSDPIQGEMGRNPKMCTGPQTNPKRRLVSQQSLPRHWHARAARAAALRQRPGPRRGTTWARMCNCSAPYSRRCRQAAAARRGRGLQQAAGGSWAAARLVSRCAAAAAKGAPGPCARAGACACVSMCSARATTPRGVPARSAQTRFPLGRLRSCFASAARASEAPPCGALRAC